MSTPSVSTPISAQTLATKLRRIRIMTDYLEQTIPDVPDPRVPHPSPEAKPGVGTFLNRSV